MHHHNIPQTISESGGVLRAEIVNFKEGGKPFSPALVTYSVDGYVRAFRCASPSKVLCLINHFIPDFPPPRFSIPSLRNMICNYFVAADPRVVATINFAPYGHGLYFCNATEVQKFSISAAFVKQGCIHKFTLVLFSLKGTRQNSEHGLDWGTTCGALL